MLLRYFASQTLQTEIWSYDSKFIQILDSLLHNTNLLRSPVFLSEMAIRLLEYGFVQQSLDTIKETWKIDFFL